MAPVLPVEEVLPLPPECIAFSAIPLSLSIFLVVVVAGLIEEGRGFLWEGRREYWD